MSELGTIPGAGSSGSRMFFQQECVFWITAVLLLFIFLWSSALDGHEAELAESAREMMLTGNWFHATVNWEIRHDLSIPACWSIVPFAKLFGPSELASRLPSAIGALAVLGCLRLLGKQLFNGRTAFISCWMLLGSYGFLLWGRSAASDMGCMAALTGAVAWFFHREEKGGFLADFIFFLLCFTAALFKDLMAALLPVLIVLPRAVLKEGKFRLNWKTPLAFFLAAFLFFLWLCLPGLMPPGPGQAPAGNPGILNASASVWQYHILPALNLFARKEHWYAYICDLPRVLLPWTPLLLVGLAGFFKSWRSLPEKIKLTAAGTGIALIFFIISGSDYWSYGMPLAPFIMLFGAAGLSDYGVERWNKWAFAAAFYICLAGASLCLCSIIGYPLWKKIADYTPPAALVLAPVITGGLCWSILFMDHAPGSALSCFIGLPHRAGAVFLTGTLLTGCAISVLLPVIRGEFRTEKHFFLELHRAVLKLPESGSPALVTFQRRLPPEYLFYNNLTLPVPRTDDLELPVFRKGGTQTVVLFKDRSRIREAFFSQCRKKNVTDVEHFMNEEISRWSSPDSRNNRYTAYLISLPNERTKKNEDRR